MVLLRTEEILIRHQKFSTQTSLTRVAFCPFPLHLSFPPSCPRTRTLAVGRRGGAGGQHGAARMADHGCTLSLGVTGDNTGKLGRRRCALPRCSPAGIICLSGVVFFSRRGQQWEKLMASLRAYLGVHPHLGVHPSLDLHPDKAIQP